jgi:hypothetical protein
MVKKSEGIPSSIVVKNWHLRQECSPALKSGGPRRIIRGLMREEEWAFPEDMLEEW